MEENNKRYEKYTLGWLREQQRIKAKKDGFDIVDDWLKWKADPFNILEKKHGKEFADWARQNKNKIYRYVIDAGCKTWPEYLDKCAKNRGFKNHTESVREWTHEIGITLPMSENKYCSSYFGIYIAENYIMKTFEDPIPAPPNNPYFDWTCKRGQKIQHKARCLGWTGWKFNHIDFNPIADYFILSAWNDRDDLIPLHIWMFHRDDIVRGDPFWMRRSLNISDTSKRLKEFEKYEVTDRLEKLNELCKKLQE